MPSMLSLAASVFLLAAGTSTSLRATSHSLQSLLEKRDILCRNWEFGYKAHSLFGGSQLTERGVATAPHSASAVTSTRLRGGSGFTDTTETPENVPGGSSANSKSGGSKSAREPEKEESYVHFANVKCKQNTLVMISRNFTTAEWARPFVGLHGKLVSPGEIRGTWNASFGNQSGIFHVGADGISHLAYFDESVPEHHYRLAAAVVATHGSASLAKAIFERALEIAPSNVNCLSGYGMLIHSKFHDCAGAEEYFKRAMALAPQNVDTLCNYGAVLLDEFKRDYTVRSRARPHPADPDPGLARRAAHSRLQGSPPNADRPHPKSLVTTSRSLGRGQGVQRLPRGGDALCQYAGCAWGPGMQGADAAVMGGGGRGRSGSWIQR